jgi:hypothetical protein
MPVYMLGLLGFGAWRLVGYQSIGNMWHIARKDGEMKT